MKAGPQFFNSTPPPPPAERGRWRREKAERERLEYEVELLQEEITTFEGSQWAREVELQEAAKAMEEQCVARLSAVYAEVNQKVDELKRGHSSYVAAWTHKTCWMTNK